MKRSPIVDQDVAGMTSQDFPWDELAGKTVLISEANGFLPADVVETVKALTPCSTSPSWIISADHVMNGGRTSC